MKTIKIFFIIIGALLLNNCSAPTRNDSTTTGNKSSQASRPSHDTSIAEVQAAMQSEITCPKCGYKKTEIMPTDVCVIKYNCEKCSAELRPKEGDCCVFCTYGTHKCPSMQ